MAMVRKDGKLPANARVDVDYIGKKPKIKFSYPKFPAEKKKKGKKYNTVKEDAISQNAIGLHTIILLFIFTLIGGYFYITYVDFYVSPSHCEVELDEYHFKIETNLTDYVEGDDSFISKGYDSVYGANFYCDTGNYSVRWISNAPFTGISTDGFTRSSTDSPAWQLWEIMRFFLWVMVAIVIFSFINKFITKFLVGRRWYQKWLPEHNARQRTKKYWRFTAKDFDQHASPFVEVPNFKNVSIEYKTTGEFSDCLQRIKIREHKYHKYDTKKKKVGKLKVEVSKWWARFYFDKVPKTGYMEVVYY